MVSINSKPKKNGVISRLHPDENEFEQKRNSERYFCFKSATTVTNEYLNKPIFCRINVNDTSKWTLTGFRKDLRRRPVRTNALINFA